jgi:uncharacterized protein YfaS (alpha-2-macroglobulin family)
VYVKELKASALGRKFKRSNKGASFSQETALRSMPIPVPPGDSGDYTGRTRWVYQELRDRKVVLFIDKLPEGVWEIRYDMRAETPGKFHALPVLGHAMYIPEIRANGEEIRINITDRDD